MAKKRRRVNCGRQCCAPNWDISPEDEALVVKIIDRAEVEGLLADVPGARLNATMDVEACHLNGTPLDLSRLLNAPAADFGHDLLGISRHVDRDTGRLTGLFLPRCAAMESAVAP